MASIEMVAGSLRLTLTYLFLSTLFDLYQRCSTFQLGLTKNACAIYILSPLQGEQKDVPYLVMALS